MSDSAKKTNSHEREVESAEWRDVTGKFKVALDLLEKDQELNGEKIRRQTESLRKRCADVRAVSKSVKR